MQPLMDAAVMTMITDKSDYGKSRLFGQIGFGIGSFLGGGLLNQWMFLVHLLIAVPTLAIMLSLSNSEKAALDRDADTTKTLFRRFRRSSANVAKEKEENVDVMAGLALCLKDPKLIIFFTVVFLIGLSSGIIENFAYVRMKEVAEGTPVEKTNYLGLFV